MLFSCYSPHAGKCYLQVKAIEGNGDWESGKTSPPPREARVWLVGASLGFGPFHFIFIQASKSTDTGWLNFMGIELLPAKKRYTSFFTLFKEGGYIPFDSLDVDYSVALRGVGIFRLRVESHSIKNTNLRSN